jgi:glycerol-3-phosphate dehydrogenase (NAD(P)+)
MRVSVIGAGSFGTAIAQTISGSVSEVVLFGRSEGLLRGINMNHINPKYHPLVPLSENIRASDLAKDAPLLQESDLVVFAIPSGPTRQVTRSLSCHLRGKAIISTAKGIECPSLKTMSRVIADETGDTQVSSFSGATFADELILGAFSCATLGISEHTSEKVIVDAFSAPHLILDTSRDVQGVELCGVLKNVYAIATGIFDATITGYNQHYGFLSLCFKEMERFLRETSSDLNLSRKFCAHGDLHLTANVDKSRNRILGFIVGKLWATPQSVRSKAVIEGVKSARAMRAKSQLLGIETPIINFVNACFDDPTRVREYVAELMETSRPRSFEDG